MQESTFYKIKKNIRKLTEFPLVKIEDKIVNESDDYLIPSNVLSNMGDKIFWKNPRKISK